MKTILSTADAPAAIGPYSQAVRSGETLYCSGQLGMADFPLVNTEYSKVFAENPPARSCVAVKELPLGGLVEI